jgi:hypothetical protein
MDPLILTGPTPVACRVGNGFVPVIYHPDRGPDRHPRKAKATAQEAIAYAARVLWYRQIRTNEARRRLAAISDPWWVEVVASLNLKPMAVHTPVNPDRTSFDAWR